MDGAGVVGIVGVGGGTEGRVFEGFHEREKRPGGGGRSVGAEGKGTEAVRAEAFTKLLDLMATLDGGLGGGGGEEGGASREIGGDLVPVGSAKVGAAKGVPFVAVGFDEG